MPCSLTFMPELITILEKTLRAVESPNGALQHRIVEISCGPGRLEHEHKPLSGLEVRYSSGCRDLTISHRVSILKFLGFMNLLWNFRSRIALQTPFFFGTIKKIKTTSHPLSE